MELDSIDRRILNMLQNNSKLTTKELAAALNMTTTPIHERIKRLEKRGYILNYVALLDRRKMEHKLMAFLYISVRDHSQQSLLKFQQAVIKFPKVVECYHIAGQFDFVLKILVKDMEDYHNFTFNRLASLKNIRQVQTDFVINDLKYSTIIPFDV